MYIPLNFKETRPQVLSDFILANSFGSLVTAGAQGLFASHLPFVFDPTRGSQGVLISHMARQNPQWKYIVPDAEVMAMFLGPHGYISPLLYESKMTVPTWNYSAVHVYGRARMLEDRQAVLDVLKATVAQHEVGPDSWKISDVPADYIAKLAEQIVAFEIDVTRIEGKFKLNQNRPLADQEHVAKVMLGSEFPGNRELGKLMRGRLDERGK